MTSPVRAPRPTPRRIEQPEPARRDHLRVVQPPTRPSLRRRRTTAVFVVATLLVFGSLMASALFHGQLVGGQAELDDLSTQIQDEKTGLAQDKLELANLQSPSRIAAAAEHLGMIPAERQHWLSPGTGADPVVTGSTTDTTQPADTTTPADTTKTADELAGADGGGAAQ